ncbi:hypothetical protein ADIMK_4206 [Marinobacterium lacunae]|uniref:Tetratricopeptide repeat protein n=1 Tax=Marinobacterium lacunae TaxID=1232683 RepID=A0A081FT94_9GAMM|nr:hypothetical protein [Marinobacterium lacunae]KEA61749.1 hypothetical protein ADIMK_4206 [Marinobacterium lacunae]
MNSSRPLSSSMHRFKHLCVLPVFLLVASCVANGPVSSVEPDIHFVSQPVTAGAAESVTAQLSEQGLSPERYGLLTVYRQQRFTASAVLSALSVGDDVVASMKSGRTTIPIEAGEYPVSVSWGLPCSNILSASDCETNPYPETGSRGDMKIEPGQALTIEIYFHDYRFGLKQSAAPAPASLEVVEPVVAKVTLPEAQRAKQVAEAIAVASVKQPEEPQQPSAQPVQVMAQSKSVDIELSPEATRDKLLIGITNLLKAGKPKEALPLFEQLDQLPFEPDPSLDFYWGRALVQSGYGEPGLTKLYRYIKTQGSGATQYMSAIHLINQVEAGQ